jgi:hypothetical protein
MLRSLTFGGSLLGNHCTFVRFCDVTEGVVIYPSSELLAISGEQPEHCEHAATTLNDDPNKAGDNEASYSFSTDTSVALMIAKTVSPSLRFIRFTEPVVIIDVRLPAAVRMTTSDTTLSETIFSIVPGNRFRMLVLISFIRFRPCRRWRGAPGH